MTIASKKDNPESSLKSIWKSKSEEHGVLMSNDRKGKEVVFLVK